MANNGEALILLFLWFPKLFNNFGIKIYNERMGNTVGSLTQAQKSIIVGSLLGDGYLRIMPGRKNAFLEINHSISEKDYVDRKYQKLRNLVKTPPNERKGNGKRIAYRFFTQQHPELTEFYLKFYQKKRKIVLDLKLNPLIMAVWFMDDGSRSYRTYYLNIQCFGCLSQKRLIRILREQYRIDSSLNRDKEYYRIRIKQSSARRFKKSIHNYIIPTMRYKLGE